MNPIIGTRIGQVNHQPIESKTPKYQIENHIFHTKKEITDYFRGIRDKYNEGDIISNLNDIKMLIGLTKLIHKGAYLKYYCYFYVAKNRCDTIGFRMKLKSGYSETISYSMKNYNHESEVKDALRWAIKGDILTFRHKNQGECIHHDTIPFEEIVEDFLTQYPAEVIHVKHMEEGGFELIDNLMKETWIIDFHRKLASLQALSIAEHKQCHGEI